MVTLSLAASLTVASSAPGSGQSSPSGRQPSQLLSRGLDLARQGELAEAEPILEQAQRLAPDDPEVLTVLGKVKGKLGERDLAVTLFRRVTQLTPRSAEAHLSLAIALADEMQLDSALHECSVAVQLAPGLAAAHLTRARLLAGLHRADDAAAEFSVASRLAPQDPESYYYWALLERDQGNSRKEAALLQTVVKLQPQNERAFYLLGCSLSAQSKETEAVAAWRKAIALDPDYIPAIYRLWQSERETNPAEANELQQRFSALRKQSNKIGEVRSLGNQAYLAMKARHWSEAIPLFRQALDLCGDCSLDAGLHKDLGLALCSSGNTAECQTELRTALKLNPNDTDTVKALAMLNQGRSH